MKTRHVLAVLAAGAIGFVAAGCGRTPAATPPAGRPPLGKPLTDEPESVPFDIMLLPDKFSQEQALTFERVFGELTPEKHKMYEASKHRAAGLYCVTCHLDAEIDAEAGTARLTSFKVPTQVCAECHEDEHEGFTKSRHAEALTVFSHVIRYHALNGYPAMQQQGCNKCHEKVGNSCTSCHPGHLFKSPKPPVDDYGGCAQCHLGIDHHQLESYQSSVHYQVAQASGDGTPNCVYCHSEDDNPHDIFRIKGEPDHGRTKMT
ncbi:MAG: hypothetical protein CMJ48_03815, partial [Planctomycetaceae bacterium]|nr:hypothetical protein [Planctomycetaceae bacterium]